MKLFIVRTAAACILIVWNGVMAETSRHVENFNGVDITFLPPNMPEQRSFQLRGVLNKIETDILVPAIPTIAKFLNYVRRNNPDFSDKLHEYRMPYQYINDSNVWLVPRRTHHWKVSDNSIQFVTDYIVNYGKVGGGTMGEYLFRDSYSFKKVDGKWLFDQNIGPTPYGFLKCKKTDKKCTADADLW